MDYAKFDPCVSRIRIRHYEHVPGYLGAMIHCLKHGDNEAARLIKDRNSSDRNSDYMTACKGKGLAYAELR